MRAKAPPLTALEQQTVRDNLRLGYKMCLRFLGAVQAAGGEFEDLKQEAALALAHAARRYDPDHPSKAKFSTFAAGCVRRHLERYVWRLGFAKLPDGLRGHCDPAALRPYVCLMGLVGAWALHKPDLAADQEADAVRNERACRLRALMRDRLDPRQCEVLRRRHGLGGKEETLEEVGRALGVTRERVRQIQAKAERVLRQALVAQPRADW